jgi:hypothetical protein
MKRPIVGIFPVCVLGLASCVAPGIQGPGGTVQGTANVENLERQSPVTPAPNDAANAANAAWYGSGSRYYGRRYYGPCGYEHCYDRPYPWY